MSLLSNGAENRFQESKQEAGQGLSNKRLTDIALTELEMIHSMLEKEDLTPTQLRKLLIHIKSHWRRLAGPDERPPNIGAFLSFQDAPELQVNHFGSMNRCREDLTGRFQALIEAANEQGTADAECALKNLRNLAMKLDFTSIQLKLLEFFTFRSQFKPLLEVLNDRDSGGSIDLDQYAGHLAFLLKVEPGAEISDELSMAGLLVEMKFLDFDDLAIDFNLDRSLARVLASSNQTKQLIESLIGHRALPLFKRADFAYMGDDMRSIEGVLAGYLASATEERSQNMFFYGPPGTGKTELASSLGALFNPPIPVYLVGNTLPDETTSASSKEPTKQERLALLARAAFVIRKTGLKGILIVDEAEDIIRDVNGPGNKAGGSKAFLNNLVETLGVPVVFISNRRDLIDDSMLRRIAPAFYIGSMPRAKRIEVINTNVRKEFSTELPSSIIEQLADYGAELSVGVTVKCIRDAARIRRHALGGNGVENQTVAIGREIFRQFKNAMTAQRGGVSPLPPARRFQLKDFEPRLAATSIDLLGLVDELSPSRGKNQDVVIVGPRRSGRTSIAQFLAAKLGYSTQIVELNIKEILDNPSGAYSDEFQRAESNYSPIIFDNAGPFFQLFGEKSLSDHPIFRRVRALNVPTFFVSNLPKEWSEEDFLDVISDATHIVRTGYLRRDQLLAAGRILLGVDLRLEDFGSTDIPIGVLRSVRDRLLRGGSLGDRTAAIAGLRLIEQRGQSPNSSLHGIGFER